VLEIIDELRETGHRALVFSQFTSHLALVREALDRAGITYEYLDGSTPSEQRTKRIAAFQGGSADLFLISLKAGGTGLNLTAADSVIHLDPWWNPAVEDQATDRAYRIGQQRAVQVHKLVCAGTVEDRVAQLLGKKRELASKVVGAGERWITELGDAELRELVALSKDAVVSDADAGEEERGR
ncbi:MAG: SNF2-related protein, partial [Labilithrix sp.]|nr:SNF2-related protein [Labilithrix sp.]